MVNEELEMYIDALRKIIQEFDYPHYGDTDAAMDSLSYEVDKHRHLIVR